MGKIYVSQLFDSKDAGKVLKDKETGIEIIEFGIGHTLDTGEAGIDEYLKKNLSIIKDRPLSLHGPFLDLNTASFDSLIRKATMVRYNQTYHAAKRLGADRIVFHSGHYDQVYYKEPFIKNSIEFWKEFLEDKDDSVKIHIENVMDKTPEVIADIVDGVGSCILNACLDIGHANCYSEISADDWISSLGSRIGHVHLHNNNGKSDSHSGIRNGIMDIDRIMELLNNYCDNPSMTIEVSDAEEMSQSIDYLKRIQQIF